MKNPYRCCIFDLDGTIINTIHALTYTTNLVLEQFGLGPLTEVCMKQIVGDGYRMQMKRSLEVCGDKELAHLEESLPIYGFHAFHTSVMRLIGQNRQLHPRLLHTV